MNSNSQVFFALAAAISTFSTAHAALVVHEGFDYTVGDDVSGNGAAVDGWGGAWTGGDWDVISGQSFGALEVSGGAAQRPSRIGNSATSRDISAASGTALTVSGSTIWFSVLLQATGSPATDPGGTPGYATNTWGTLVFGDTALTGGSGNSPAPMGAGGNAIGVGFRGGNGDDFANVQVQGVIYNGGAATATTDALSPTVGASTILIVGSVQWAADGTDDTLTLYNVPDPSAALPGSFTTLTADLNQSAFDVISIGDAQTSIYDEIRFGTELADVLPIPEPSAFALVGLSALGFLRRRRS